MMQYSFSWQAYQNNICNGFSSLQQNGEFVDMTLAADGHLVRVHQMLIALASPYLKEIIQSAPCPHPVVFLNNISHKTLCSLLEYIYTGEALIPADNLPMFLEAAKALHIKGLEDMSVGGNNLSEPSKRLSSVDHDLYSGTGVKNVKISAGNYMQQVPALAAFPQKSKVIKRDLSFGTETDKLSPEYSDNDAVDDMMDYEDTIVATTAKDVNRDLPAMNLQFTVSNRGSLQVILNRYMYNLHSTSRRSGVKRWRCVEYRNKRCQAFLITNGNVVLNRANLHNHSFHDKKILGKLEKKAIYSTIDDVKGIREKDPEDGKDNEKDSDAEDVALQDYDRLETLIDDDKDQISKAS